MTDLALLLLPLAGFAAGFVDAVAGGGGLLTVPALLAADIPAALALGTNKGQAVFGAVVSSAGYGRAGLLRPRVVRWGFPAGLLGSWLGAWLVTRIDPQKLGPVVLVLLLLAAALTLLPRPRAVEELSAGEAPRAEPRSLLFVVAAAIGAYDGFFGPGTGTLLIVAFLWIFRETALSASANAKVVNLASNLAACVLFASKGLILWKVALPMAAANMLGAWAGTRVTLRAGSKFVRAVAVCVALTLAARAALRLSG